MTKEQILDMMLAGNNTRQIVIKLLGGDCYECGFSGDSHSGFGWKAIYVKNESGSVQRTRGKQEATYWQELITDIMAGGKGYSLQCANCGAIAKHAKLGGPKRSAPQQPNQIYLFACDTIPSDMPDNIAWAEQLAPVPVFMYHSDSSLDECVWSYSPRKIVFDNWNDMCARFGVELEPGTSGFVTVK